MIICVPVKILWLKFKVGLYNLRLINWPWTDFCRPPVVQVLSMFSHKIFYIFVHQTSQHCKRKIIFIMVLYWYKKKTIMNASQICCNIEIHVSHVTQNVHWTAVWGILSCKMKFLMDIWTTEDEIYVLLVFTPLAGLVMLALESGTEKI